MTFADMPNSPQPNDMRIYRGSKEAAQDAAERLSLLPNPPPWRAFSGGARTKAFTPDEGLIKIVNAAFLLRRPILLEGEPGSGKTSLAYAVAEELGLPGPFRWSITSRTTLVEGLYLYDALARLHDSQMKDSERQSKEDPGRYFRLGPVGMAFAVTMPKRPAVLLIDEIDKSDMDLPSDLLHLFEEGGFFIPELERLEQKDDVPVLPYLSSGSGAYTAASEETQKRLNVKSGHVRCQGEFPLVIMTSNQNREFPGPFLRRCLRVKSKSLVTQEELLNAAREHLAAYAPDIQKEHPGVAALITRFMEHRQTNVQSFDQLLNSLVLLLRGQTEFETATNAELLEAVWASLGTRQKP